ncbi:MAG: hypothetical protein HQL37_14130 [Alphaproteobacteria bacterium]|nr:hypothetical protein [Alphaproteobacteria bacterium]
MTTVTLKAQLSDGISLWEAFESRREAIAWVAMVVLLLLAAVAAPELRAFFGA